MESPSSTIDSTAAEPKTAAAVAAAASEKENDVVMRKSRKRSSASAAISHLSSRSLIPNVNAANESHGMIQQQQQTQQQPRHQQTQPRDDGNANARTKSARRSSGAAVTPPRPSSSASGDFQDEGTAKVDFERQAHHFQAANVPQKRAKASNKKAVPKKTAAKKRAAKAAAKAAKVDFERQAPHFQAAPKAAPKKKHRKSNTQADLLNIGTDHFSIIRLSLFNKMIPGELQKFCLKTVGLYDTYTKSDGKLYFALKPGPILKPIEKNKFIFKALIDEYCQPLSALVAILEPHLLNLYPLLLLGQLHMHADRKINYPVDGVIERWCFNITGKNMQLQQQGNRDNHVVFPCDHGNLVCMSDKARGIVEIADGMRLEHGCPTAVMEAVGSDVSFTVVMDLCFGSKAVKNTVLEQLFIWFTSAVPSDSDSNSIITLKEVATTVAVATRSSILLHDIDPHGIVKKAIDEKATYLLTTCNSNKECCVKDCKDRHHSPARGPLYCKRHSDPSTRCANCKTRGLPDGSETKLCSTCLKARRCRVEGCKDQRNCGEHGHLHKYCKKHRNRNTRCARCNVKALEGGAKTFCLDCKKKFRKEMEEALSLSLS